MAKKTKDKHTNMATKDRATQTPLKLEAHSGAPEGRAVSAQHVAPIFVFYCQIVNFIFDYDDIGAVTCGWVKYRLLFHLEILHGHL